LFNSGLRPAVNVGLSVSRVSGAQTKALKKVAGSLKLDLAQYADLLAFAQFGSELDRASQKALDRGRRAVEILKQPENHTHSFVDQTIFLFLLKEGFLDKLKLEDVKAYTTQFVSYVKGTATRVYNKILDTAILSNDDEDELRRIEKEFTIIYSKT
jgi:F-type H+-transporting ATPase subunit alpha